MTLGVLIPSQQFKYLGLNWDSTQAQISLPQRLQDLASMVSQLLSNQPLCSDLMRLLGLMSAAIPAIPLIGLRSRHLQRSLIQVYKMEADLHLPVSLSSQAKEACASTGGWKGGCGQRRMPVPISM